MTAAGYVQLDHLIDAVAILRCQPCGCTPAALNDPDGSGAGTDQCPRCAVLGLLTPLAVAAFEPPF